MRERVLITGGAGFLGANLVRELLRRGRDVHLLLRPSTDRRRLAGLETVVAAHAADLLDPAAVRRAVADCRPDVVYHLAAAGAAGPADRAAVLAANVFGTAHLLDAAFAVGCRIFVHAGSGAEYGPRDGPVPEDDRLAPRSDYAVAKAAASLLCRAEALRGRPVVVVRVFAAYGPWEADRRLTPYLMGCCARGEPPRVSAGRQRRDFVYAGDVAELLCAAAESPDAVGQVLHAATGRAATVRDFVETLRDVCGGRVAAEYGAEAARPDEPPLYLAAVGRTAALTGWAPRHDLRAGLAATWDWFREAGRAAA
jgi:nucleoside-diphosphate-sugar epimerase